MRKRRLFIGLVVVAEAQKRHGIATQLVQAAENWAQDQGVYLAICDTYLGSPQSLPFWRSGWATSGALYGYGSASRIKL
jgi:GNAT superfamily N-acetyltransferase